MNRIILILIIIGICNSIECVRVRVYLLSKYAPGSAFILNLIHPIPSRTSQPLITICGVKRGISNRWPLS